MKMNDEKIKKAYEKEAAFRAWLELKDKVHEISLLQSAINSAEGNLKSYDRVFDYGEIKISSNVDEGISPIYITGKKKSGLKAVLVEVQENIIHDAEEKLKKIINKE